MKNAKITRAFLKSAAENAIKKRRNSICTLLFCGMYYMR